MVPIFLLAMLIQHHSSINTISGHNFLEHVYIAENAHVQAVHPLNVCNQPVIRQCGTQAKCIEPWLTRIRKIDPLPGDYLGNLQNKSPGHGVGL